MLITQYADHIYYMAANYWDNQTLNILTLYRRFKTTLGKKYHLKMSTMQGLKEQNENLAKTFC